MAEIPLPIDITKYKAPRIDGSLALAGGSPPTEPPSFVRRKRHLALVEPWVDRPKEEVQASSPIAEVVPLFGRRKGHLALVLPLADAPAIEVPTKPQIIDEVAEQRKPKSKRERIVKPRLPQPEVLFDPARYEPYRQMLPSRQDVFVAEAKEEEKVDSEFFYSKEWVQAEVEKVKQETVRPGETPWWHLNGTGFWVREQVGQLVRHLKGVGKEAFPNVLELELSKVSEDFRHFEMEYLKQMATLTFNLDLQYRDGQMRVICPDYKGAGEDANGSLWSSITSKDERDGVVYETLFGNEEKGTIGVEGEIQKAHQEARQGKGKKKTWVINSFAGWSGYDGITYPESQIYAIQMQEDGSLKAHTFRIDATLDQGEDLQRRLGLTVAKSTDSRQRIKNALANVATLTPEGADQAEAQGRRGVRSFEDLVDVIQESVGGREVAYGEGGGVRTFSEIKSYLANPDRFSQHHEMTDKLSKRFESYARWRLGEGGSWDEIERDLAIAKAFDPLQLNQAYDLEATGVDGGSSGPTAFRRSGGNESGPALSTELAIIEMQAAGRVNHAQQKEKLEEKPGCAGGGSSNKNVDSRYASKYVTSMGGSREAAANGDYSGENAKDDPNLCRCGSGGGPHFHCPGAEGKSCGKAITVGEGISECACGAGKIC